MGNMREGGGKAHPSQLLTLARPLDTVCLHFKDRKKKPRSLFPHPLRELKEFPTLPTPRDRPVSIDCVTQEHQLGACAASRDSL